MYNLDYELVHSVALEIEENMFGGMALTVNGKYLVCTHHQEGQITIMNTEDFSIQTECPFGEIENIWGVKLVEKPFM